MRFLGGLRGGKYKCHFVLSYVRFDGVLEEFYGGFREFCEGSGQVLEELSEI